MTIIDEWRLTFISESPLRIGDDQELVLDQDGYPMLPGTSWAGACRSFVFKNYGPEITRDLFGGIDQKRKKRFRSSLIFSDGRSEEKQPLDIRPGIAIDGKTKTAKSGHLFERMFVSSGVQFKASLTLRTTTENQEKRKFLHSVVVHMLQAIHEGEIRFGSHVSIGGGRFSIKSCEHVKYNCQDQEDLIAYIEQTKEYQPLELKQKERTKNIIKISFAGETLTPLLIGGQFPQDSNQPDVVHTETLHEGKSKVYIPASSIKGVLRHQVTKIAKTLAIKNKNAYISQLFGSSHGDKYMQASQLLINDIFLHNVGRKRYSRIAINPFTGGVKNGAVIEEKTVLGRFTGEIHFHLSNDQKKNNVSLALLLFALRDLALQQVSIGSGASIGRGYLTFHHMKVTAENQEIFFDFNHKKIDDRNNWLSVLQKSLDEESLLKEGVQNEN